MSWPLPSRLSSWAFAEDFPGTATFLVDTYDSEGGVRAAIEVARRLRLAGPVGVQLDSGDLARLTGSARRLLDEAGLPGARIFASGGLDEYAIAALAAQGAPIDAYGVGAKLAVPADAPSLDSACKLVAYAGRPVMRLSPGKATEPGAKQVYRSPAVMLSRCGRPPGRARTPSRAGHVRRPAPEHPPPLAEAQRRCSTDLAWLPPTARTAARPKPDRSMSANSFTASGPAHTRPDVVSQHQR